MDALGHVNIDGRVYPGAPVDEAISGGTVRRGSSTPFTTGVTTRGVLLDLAPEGALDARRQVTAADLEEAEQRGGVRVESGDALVVRGGWTISAEPPARCPR
ncbi:cyclase family protein [Actinoplanes sp. NPDC051470]|uniref:cyclase family protein n=1 Tax=Actinoplanes sp. NPDC051470 TaxID=3157224 RepID=UPI003426BD3B